MMRSRRKFVGLATGGALAGNVAVSATAACDLKQEKVIKIDARSFGVSGDGKTDDSGCVAAACEFAAGKFAGGDPCYISFPSGRYLLKRTQIPMFRNVPVGIKGQGPQQTVFIIAPEYRWDVFSWSNCWLSTTFGPQTIAGQSRAGAFVEHVGFVGNLCSSAEINVLGFYDINDFVRVNNVEFDYIPGRAIYSGGLTRGNTIGIIRESRFSEIRIFRSGTRSCPSIELGSSGESDSTNEIIFSMIDIFWPAGDGFVICNKGVGPLRLIKIFGLRVEKTSSSFTAFKIGTEAESGRIYGINALGLELVAGDEGSTALAVIGVPNNHVEFCHFQGQIINWQGNGIFVNTGNGITIDLLQNWSNGVGLTLKNTKNPLYYTCPSNTTMSIDAGCELLSQIYRTVST